MAAGRARSTEQTARAAGNQSRPRRGEGGSDEGTGWNRRTAKAGPGLGDQDWTQGSPGQVVVAGATQVAKSHGSGYIISGRDRILTEQQTGRKEGIDQFWRCRYCFTRPEEEGVGRPITDKKQRTEDKERWSERA